MTHTFPDTIPNLIEGTARPADSGLQLEKRNPATGAVLCSLARSSASDVDAAVRAARVNQPAWGDTPAVRRGLILHDIVLGMKARREEIARIVALETGKSFREALGETDGAIQCALFYVGEGQRLFGRTCQSGVTDKYALNIRRPVGVAGLIIAANTPIANVAWKVFPALICGNSAVLKAAEDTPATAWIVGIIAKEAGLPDGVLNIVQGLGEEAGAPLVAHRDVGVVSFTGSTEVGRFIARTAGDRLAKVSLELGGKNPLVVCDDSDLDKAVTWTLLSAFSNAGQRCASGSRIIVFESVYEAFKTRLLAATARLRVGAGDGDDLGPVINEKQLLAMISEIEKARAEGAAVLAGGGRLEDEEHRDGYFMAPTVIENVPPAAGLSTIELFGPVTCLYKAADFNEALALANASPYGLTACIHTANFDRAWEFCQKVDAGVAVVNAGTYGSEPHMPFGGTGLSGNGSREPGTEALDIYSDLKNIYLNVDRSRL